MPRLHPDMESGIIIEWLKKEGDVVKQGEPVLVVEDEKTTFEVDAPSSGRLTKILVSVGANVPVNHTIAIIEEHA